ncbi:MAG: hypothetical protein ACLSB9_36660 [Hydrogeniiclostridium mannosilyticum]
MKLGRSTTFQFKANSTAPTTAVPLHAHWYPDGSHTPYTRLLIAGRQQECSMNLTDSVTIRGISGGGHIAPQTMIK